MNLFVFRTENEDNCGESENQRWGQSGQWEGITAEAGERRRETHSQRVNVKEKQICSLKLFYYQIQAQLEVQGLMGVKVRWRTDANNQVVKQEKDDGPDKQVHEFIRELHWHIHETSFSSLSLIESFFL